MKAQHLSTKDVTEGTGLPNSTINKLLSCDINAAVSFQDLSALCMFLEVDLNRFLMYSPDDIRFNVSQIPAEKKRCDEYKAGEYLATLKTTIRTKEKRFETYDNIYLIPNYYHKDNESTNSYVVVLTDEEYKKSYRSKFFGTQGEIELMAELGQNYSINNFMLDEADMNSMRIIRKIIESPVKKYVESVKKIHPVNELAWKQSAHQILIDFDYNFARETELYLPISE
ncbi:helix-turn-helix transcriptional regulator [Lactobacillus sp. Sy-1]|nr:helix-turn-helix transcriptional regulator [Lactobacillus sp. Sy-1]